MADLVVTIVDLVEQEISGSARDAGPSRESPGVVTDPRALVATIWRMHATKDGSVVFLNSDGTMKIMLRDVPGSRTGSATFDVSIVVGGDDDPARHALGLDNTGYWEDDDDTSDVFVIDEFSLAAGTDPRGDVVARMVTMINWVYAWTICPCGKYIIKDGARMCLFCEMSGSPSEQRMDVCPICYETGLARWMTTQACCNQTLHRSCLERWSATSTEQGGQARCPMCRAGEHGR